MKVRFIGAGPGDPELLTLKALRYIKAAPVIIYAGSLVPEQILEKASSNATIINSAPLNLGEITDLYLSAKKKEIDVARLHSGDPSVYGAITEQMQILDTHRIDYEVIPGVTALSAASALLKKELTVPDVSQSVIQTRIAAKTPMPSKEELGRLGAHQTTLAVYLSVSHIHRIVDALVPHYGADCPVKVCYRVGWPDQMVVEGILSDIVAKVRAKKITRTALVLVGAVFGDAKCRASWLYDAQKAHIYRPKRNPFKLS